ncbi:hypothetical protein TELCIR_09401 [Teladorsagia circumcincta]|uniref:AB hydrolase-1 domain-containing protein n=1 Tax=Teladorsagia circumcincta TaxID=45464 RepID=A0A2G9UEV2_TELCI|nr:hypothetical protein TELCIR_09401 [Teladorsagia circumcincta]
MHYPTHALEGGFHDWSEVEEVVIRRYASARSIFDLENGLFSVPVRFKNNRGDVIKLDAVYQDTMPEGGEKAILFGIHGSPGSHADFKYLAPELRKNGVRMVMPNFPGQGYTPELGGATLGQRNNGFLDSFNVKLSSKFQKNVRGVVMLNSAGLRIHRGIEPVWKIDITVRLLDLRILNFLLHPFLYFG